MTIEEIIKRQKEHLTKAQIGELIQATERYKQLNASNRASAMRTLSDQYRATRRGLQNTGLAGRKGKLISGREKAARIRANEAYRQYNAGLRQIDNAYAQNRAARMAYQNAQANQLAEIEKIQAENDKEAERINAEYEEWLRKKKAAEEALKRRQEEIERIRAQQQAQQQQIRERIEEDRAEQSGVVQGSRIQRLAKDKHPQLETSDYARAAQEQAVQRAANEYQQTQKVFRQQREADAMYDAMHPGSAIKRAPHTDDYVIEQKRVENARQLKGSGASDAEVWFADAYGVSPNRYKTVKNENPELIKELTGAIQDLRTKNYDTVINSPGNIYDKHQAREEKAKAESAISKAAVAMGIDDAEMRKLYLMNDTQFAVSFAAAAALAAARQKYDSSDAIQDQMMMSGKSGAFNNATRDAEARLAKFDQVRRLRYDTADKTLYYDTYPTDVQTKDAKTVRSFCAINQNTTPYAWANPKNENGENWYQAAQNGWKAENDGNTKYGALVNDWSLVGGRQGMRYQQTGKVAALLANVMPHFYDLADETGTYSNAFEDTHVQSWAVHNGISTADYYDYVRNSCVKAFYGNNATHEDYEQMDAMLALANLMTDEERARFNELANGSYGAFANEADEYFEYLYKNVLPERFKAYVDELNGVFTDTTYGKIGQSALSVLTNLGEGITGPIHTLTTNYNDSVSAQLGAMKYTTAQAARESVSKDFSPVGKFFYDTGMSMADSASVAVISGGIGKALQGMGVGATLATKAGSVLGGSILGGSAFNSAYKEALDRGLSPEKARTVAVGQGFNEMLFESLSLDLLVSQFQKGGILKVSKNSFVNWFVNTMVQGGVEGSEEVFTDMANNLWDNKVNGIFSEELTKLREYISNGMSYEDAKRKVDAEYAEQLGMSFLGGFVSGGVMGGGSTFLGMMQNRGFERYGARMDADAKAEVRGFNFKDEQMQELAKQSKLTNQDYGVLAAAMLQQQFEEGRTYVQNALKDGTITKAQKELYDKYAQMAKDGKLTADVVASEEYAQDMDKLEPVFDIMDEGELIQQGMRDLAEAQRAVRDENAKYDKQVADIENDTTLTDEQKQQKLDAIENERGEKVVEKVRDLEKVQKKYDENVKAENGKVETKRGNLTYDFSTAKTFNEMSDRQKSAIRFAKLFADKYGMNIKVVDDSVAGERIDGEYNSKTNTITVNISGSNSVMYTVSHEVTHWLQENQSKAYNTLKSAIEKELSRTDLLVSELPKVYQDIMGDYKTEDNTVMDALVKYEQDMYKRQTGETLSKELAEDEVVARCCESFLKDRGFAQKMVAENPGTARTIAAKLRQLANDMKTLNEDALERGYEKYGDLIDNSIEKAALEQIGDVEKIARMWENALNQAEKKAAKKAKTSESVQYATNNKDDILYSLNNKVSGMNLPSLSINDSTQAFTQQILDGEKDIETRTQPIPNSIVGKWIPIIRTGKGKQTVVGYVKFSGDKVYNNAKEFDADYKYHRVGKDSPYYKDGKKYGWIISDVVKLDNPIEIGTKGYKPGDFTFRDLDGIIDDPNASNFSQKAKAKFISKTYDRNGYARHLAYRYRGREYMITDENNGYSEPMSVKHKNEQERIDREIEEIVKERREGHKEQKYEGSAQEGFDLFWDYVENGEDRFSMNDKDYLSLASKVKDGTATDADKAELRKQVDAVAKENGYTIKAFHGTSSDFTKFDRGSQGKNYRGYLEFGAGFYFTPSEKEAQEWAKTSENKNGGNAHVMGVYLNPKRIIAADAPVPGGAKYLQGLGIEKGTAEFIAARTYRFINALIEERGFTNVEAQETLMALGYDAIDATFANGTGQYVVYDPSQIKSADLVTYDDKQNIIPLSERFDENMDDTRYSMNDKDFVLKKNNGEKWYELRDAKAKLYGSSVELEGGSLLNRVRMMQNLAEMYGSVTVDATSEKEAEAFKRAGAKKETDAFSNAEYGTWEFTHTENKYEQDTRYDAKQKRNFANAVLKEVGTFRNFKKEDLRIIRARLEKAFAVLHNAWHGDGDQLVAMEYADKLFDQMLNRYTEMSEADAETRDALLAEMPVKRDARGREYREIEVTATQMAEIKNQHTVAEFNAALSKALGTRVVVKQTENAKTLEDVFKDNPYLDATTNEVDMPMELLKKAQETVGKRTNPYKVESEERAALKEAMYEKALDIVGVEKSTAQKVREAVKQVRAEERAKAKTKLQTEVEKARLAERMHEGAIRAKERRASAEREMNIKRDAARREAKLKDVTKQKLEQQKLNTLRRDVKAVALKWYQRLVKMLANPTEASHIPVQLAREVAAFTDALTRYLDSGTERGRLNLEKIAKAYQQAFDDQATIAQAKAENPKYDPRGTVLDREMFDEQLVGMINELNTILQGKTLKDLDAFEMRMLLNTVRGVAHTVYEANRMIGTTERKAIWQVGDKMVSEMENAPKVSDKLRGYLETSLDLRRLALIFSGSNKNAEFVKLVDQLNKGAIEKERIAQTLQNIFKPVTDQYGEDIRKWYGKNAEWIDTGITKNGKKVEITKGMRVSLALHVLNEGNMRHIENGGLTIPNREMYRKGNLQDAYANGDLVRLNAEQINEIISHMTDAEKAYVEAAKELFHKRTGYFINKTSLALLGYRKAMVENYFPIHTDKNFTKTDFASLKMDGSVEGQGFLKERVNASNPVYLEDITSVVNRQIRGVALYAGLAIPMRNFNAVMNASIYEDDNGVWSPRTTVKQTLTQKMGAYGAKVVEGFLSDASEMSHVDVTPMERFAGKLATNYVKAVLLGNMKVALKQVASYPTAAAVIPWKYLGKALLKGGRNGRVISRADVDLINQYTPLYQMRREGQANEIASIMAKRGMEQKLPWLLGWITKMDVMTVGRLWSAAEYMVADQQKNLPVGSDAYYQAVAQVFNDTVQQTQPNFTPLQRNAALRSKNPIVRSLVLFGTQRMQNGGILMEAAYELKHSKGKSKAEIKAAKMKLGRAVASQIVQNILLIVASLGVDALRGRMKGWQDDDKEITPESLAKGMSDMFLSNFIGSFLGGSETYSLFSGLFKKAMGETAYDTEFTVPALDAVETLINFAQSDVPSTIKYLLGDHTDEEKQKKAINFSYQLAKAFGYATGIPLENALKDVFKGIIPAIEDISDAIKTGELNPWLHQSGKLDKKTTNANYKEWTNNGFKGSEYFYWENVLTAYGKREEKIPILLEADLPNEKKAMLLRMMDKSGATSEGTVVYKSNGDVLIDFANPTEKQQALPMPTAETEETATPTTTPTATPKPTENPLTDARQEGVKEAVAKGVPEQTAFDAFIAYQNMGKSKSDDYSRNDDFRAWLFKNVQKPEERAILEYQVIGQASKVEGAVTYRDSGVVYRDYTNESWFKLSEHNLSKDGTNKRYEAGKRLEKTGLSVDKTVAIYDGLKELTKKAEWTDYLKKQGLTEEQINIFLWSRGWAK